MNKIIKNKNLKFLSEKEGQIKFFEDLRITPDIELTNNTDGIYKEGGTLFEFKLVISDINKVLFQAIKYLSHLRIRGVPVPKQILLVALNEQNAYLFDSSDFLKYIEEIYAGAASKNNKEFSTSIKPEKIDFSNIKGLSRIIEILNNIEYTKIHIDVFNVVGWSEHFYRENPKATKSKLFEELRQPKQFKKYIYPWKGNDLDFKYINDLLNAKILKKELGAFYTPKLYCLKATELVRKAIKEIPKGNDYIILDRSAGTGNLEEFLTDKNVNDITISELDKYIDEDTKIKYLQDKATIIKTFYQGRYFDISIRELEEYKTKLSMHDFIFDNELSHTIVNTYELKEWIVLNERLGDKVRLIIPPEVDPKDQLVSGGDALSEIFVMGSQSQNKAKLKKEYFDIIDEVNNYVKDLKTNIILYENPPYRDSSGDNSKIKNYSNKKTFLYDKFKEQIKHNASARDLSNLFIWSAWQFYLTKKDDAYILFSPIKYWKSLGLSNKKFIDGYLFNREYFHASASSISCILWKNEEENKEELILKVFDIDNNKTQDLDDNKLIQLEDIKIKKVYSGMQEVYADKRAFPDDHIGIVGDANSNEKVIDISQDKRLKKAVFNKNIVGHLRIQGFPIAPMNVGLSTIALSTAIQQTFGFYLRSDNFIEKLPLFSAKLYPQKNWYERDVYFTTADGGDKYLKDKTFLKQCFIFTCLSQRNHCRSFDGSDGRFYKNELCFDNKTIASEKLKSYKLTKEEQDLLDSFTDILKMAKDTENYNKKYTYGIYQIDQELNTRYKSENDEWIYEYPQLNTVINGLKTKLAKYYENNIQQKLFEYELLK